mgnify:CR=1 FL=1
MRLRMSTMSFTRIATSAWMLFALLGSSALSSAETVRLYFDPATPQIAFAAGDIKAALEKRKHTVQTHDLAALAKAGPGKKIVLAVATDKTAASILSAQGGQGERGNGQSLLLVDGLQPIDGQHIPCGFLQKPVDCSRLEVCRRSGVAGIHRLGRCGRP